MVHKESQPVPGIKIKSYTLGFSKYIDILGENHAYQLNIILNKDKTRIIKKVWDTCHRMNASYIYDIAYKLTKGQK